MQACKVALITGSGKRRIGSHVAESLAAQGYAVAIHYRTSAAEAAALVETLRGQSVAAIALAADLTDERSVGKLIEQTLAHFGRLDVLVNCAAVWGRKNLEEVTAEDVRHQFDTNTLGTFLCSQQAGLAMVGQAEGGCIVTVGDWAVARPYLGYAAYFPSKGAIPTLTPPWPSNLALATPGCAFNCILPGPVMLPPDLPDDERRQAIEATLVKREGRPEHIALTVRFLIENDFVTGICLPVDGGRTVYAPDSA